MGSDYHMQDIKGWHLFKLARPVNKAGGLSLKGCDYSHAWVPVDGDGHYLDITNMDKLKNKGKQARDLTSPYGSLAYAVGSGDDFHCFDYAELKGIAAREDQDFFDADGAIVNLGLVVVHSVINSETGGFIQDGSYEVVPEAKAVDTAQDLVYAGLDWCDGDNRIRHSMRGWNQDPTYFARCVAASVGWEDMGKRKILSTRILKASVRNDWERKCNAPAPGSFPAPAVRDEDGESEWLTPEIMET